MALGIGLSVNNGRAAIEGLFGRDVEFVRTPKLGSGSARGAFALSGYRGRWPWHNAIELAFGLYCTGTVVVAIATQSWASLPFITLFSVGFLYVGVTSLIEALRPSVPHRKLAAASQEPSTHSSPSPQSMLS
jgi:hypothetical protein